MNQRECLPIDQVMEKVLGVEEDVSAFYRRAMELTRDDEVHRAFGSLLKDKAATNASLGNICESFKCGEAGLEGATQDDIGFLSVLTETAFYKSAGKPEKLADPELQLHHLVENALKLERDLLLFYMKFFGVSCADHRPIFSDLIRRGQEHITELRNIQVRLKRDIGR